MGLWQFLNGDQDIVIEFEDTAVKRANDEIEMQENGQQTRTWGLFSKIW